MTNFTHYEKRLRPYELLGNERTPYLPEVGDEIIIRTLSKQYDKDTKLVLIYNGVQKEVSPYNSLETDKGWSYEFAADMSEYNQMVEYYFENTLGKSETYSYKVYKTSMLDSENTELEIHGDCCSLNFSVGNNIAKSIYIGFCGGKLYFGNRKAGETGIVSNELNEIRITDCKSEYYAVLDKEELSVDIYNGDGKCVVKDMRFSITHNEDEIIKISYHYDSDCDGIYATGERFNAVNRKGLKTDNMIFEQFTNQGEATYFPIPFFFTTNGYGVLNDTRTLINYDFDSCGDGYSIDVYMNSRQTVDDMCFIFGSPKDVIYEYLKLSGMPNIPPEWSFGIWISANRWNCQKHIEEQMEYMKNYNYPASVLVIEAWSDENTFYIFNEAEYETADGGKTFEYDDFSFNKEGLWTNPKKMIDELKEMGIHLVLWQIPVLKAIEDENENLQHNADTEYALLNGLCAMENDKAYKLPDFWFKQSYLPDFTNPETSKWWFEKRKYLLDIGVDGFKTDGGEFIYKDNLSFYSGDTGIEMKNQYSCEYIKSYSEFVGSDRVLFSRASYLGNQQNPIHWAGDQMSTWEELRSMVKAGLSLGLSGVPYWSFDIAGFAGDLPSDELYLRATQLAVFAPVMQWHSEPMTGQFQEVYKRDGSIINDRSPWNIAEVTGNPKVINESVKYANLRVNFLPYILSQANISAQTGRPMMRHLVYDNPHDKNVYNMEDQFMLGDLMVAPVLYEGRVQRDVYMTEGSWMDLNTGEVIKGGRTIKCDCGMENIPLYLKSGCGIAFNLNELYGFYDIAPKSLGLIKTITVLICGNKGEYIHTDTSGESIVIKWDENEYKVVKNTSGKNIEVLSSFKFNDMESSGLIKLNNAEFKIYKG